MSSIKGMTIEVGKTVKLHGKLHYVKSYQFMPGALPIVSLSPILDEVETVSIDELDKDDGESTNSSQE